MKQKIYISGKMTGLKKKDYRARFNKAEKRLRALGFKPVNPTKFYLVNLFYWLIGYRLTLIYDIWRLSKCNGIYLLNGWQFSNGARIEKQNAELMRKFILHENMTNTKIISKANREQ